MSWRVQCTWRGDVVFVPKFCWEKEEFSPKTDGELGLSIGGNENTMDAAQALTSADKTLPMSNGFVPTPCMLLLALCV